jgi:ABC-type nitrate/sulfonate/bicarbonate transport system substrate-binding protein
MEEEMRPKRLMIAGLVALLATGLLLGGGSLAKAGELERKAITIVFQPNPVFIPIAVALEKKWFAEAGFEKVDILNFTSGHLAGEALISGALSVWVPGNMPIISMRHNGLPIVVVGNLNVCPAEYLMVRKSAGVTKPEDLYKIKIGLPVGSTASGVIEELARANGLDIKKLQLINLAPPDAMTALKNNEVQAMLVWPPYPFQVQDIATYMFDSKKYSHTRVPIVFGEEYVRKNPNTTKSIMRVFYRAQEFMLNQANWSEAKAIYAKRAEQPMDIIDKGFPDYWEPGRDQGSINEQYVKDFEAYTAFQARNGMIKDPVNVLEYTYTGFLKEIRPQYVKVEGKWKP